MEAPKSNNQIPKKLQESTFNTQKASGLEFDD